MDSFRAWQGEGGPFDLGPWETNLSKFLRFLGRGLTHLSYSVNRCWMNGWISRGIKECINQWISQDLNTKQQTDSAEGLLWGLDGTGVRVWCENSEAGSCPWEQRLRVERGLAGRDPQAKPRVRLPTRRMQSCHWVWPKQWDPVMPFCGSLLETDWCPLNLYVKPQPPIWWYLEMGSFGGN